MTRMRAMPLLTPEEEAALCRIRTRRARTLNLRLHRPRRKLSPLTMARIARGVAKFITPPESALNRFMH